MKNRKVPIENPTVADALTFYDSVTGNIIKTINDAWGNIYVWDGDDYEHREIMGQKNISDDLYETAQRIYKDFGGKEELIDVLERWHSCIKGKKYIDGIWV